MLFQVRDGRRGHQLHGGLLAKVRDLTEPKQPVKVKVEVTFDKGASPSRRLGIASEPHFQNIHKCCSTGDIQILRIKCCTQRPD